MTLVTLFVAIVASGAVLVLPPTSALVAYLAVVCWYPQYLAVSIGSVDLSVGRIVVLVMVARLFSRPIDTSLLRLRWIDLFVLLAFAARVLAYLSNESAMKVIEREGGRLFDTLLAYLVTRLSVQDRSDIYRLIKGLVIIALPLAVIGAYQSATGHNPYAWMLEYDAFRAAEQELLVRYGFYRADASFGEKISFGLFFALVMALYFVKLSVPSQGKLLKLCMIQGALLIGLLSSMSSAPMFSIFVSIFFLMLFPFRRAWPYAAIAFFVVCLVLEVASDRHFYEIATRLSLNSRTANYRIELINEALGGGMSGHWLTGYGYVGFGKDNYGHNGFNWAHPDLVNLYIGYLARTGLLGLVPYLMLNASYYWCLYRAGRFAVSFEDRWLVWCISAGLVGWNIAMLTVGALEQTNTLLYVMIAVAGACPYVVRQSVEGGIGEIAAPPLAANPRVARIRS